ncbi:DedA family protein [Sagittula salina]|uniref:VTT domain-containing protein n=1 Tax=Sagittula salina TaxID=2820268 RepID=A0A940S3F8_9RHOB|nr:VTT domain-containing protein [Sagittula salina]MBP0482720.1 VTT domain-containing protein [Sagittula salina]
MSETIFGLVSGYGLWVVAVSAYLSCLAVPIPTALVMLAAGAFAAAGDLVFWQVWLVAWLAALAGDNTGYQLGRRGGVPLVRWMGAKTGKAGLIAQGEETVARYGGLGVFFSTWLVAPLGPWVNLIAGAMRLPAWRFAVWDTAGETIWVTGYVGLGFVFGAQVDTLAALVTDWAGLVAALAVAAGFALALVVKLWRRGRSPGPVRG